jgi:hypothetical protein
MALVVSTPRAQLCTLWKIPQALHLGEILHWENFPTLQVTLWAHHQAPITLWKIPLVTQVTVTGLGTSQQWTLENVQGTPPC